MDKIETSYLLVEEALSDHSKKPIQAIEAVDLDFEDTDSRERCIKFLSKLYAMLEEHQQSGDNIYLSLAGGRKSMSALMAWAVPFFPCIKGLYHIIDLDEKRFFTIDQLVNKLHPTERWRYMIPTETDIARLKLVEIPYVTQQNIDEQLRKDLLAVDLNNVDEAQIEAFQTLHEIIEGNKGDKELSVYLSQRALDQLKDLIQEDTFRAQNFKDCFKKMRFARSLYAGLHDTDESVYREFHFFKLRRTAERPVFYTRPVAITPDTLSAITEIIVCELEIEREKKYRKIKQIVESPRFSKEPVIQLKDLPSIKSDASDILIIPLGKRPMIATQLYTLLQDREQRQIKKIILIHPAQNISIQTSYSIIRDAIKYESHGKVEVKSVEIKGRADIDDTESCKLYQDKLEMVIEKEQQNNKKDNIIVSLTGGRKGMTAQTIFAAQNKEIDYVYHTLITDEDLSEQIDDETTIDILQDLSRKDRGNRLFLRSYNALEKFALFKVPVFNNKIRLP